MPRKEVNQSRPGARIRIEDVAARAGVSIATVSRVLNGTRVRAGAHERVQQAIESLGYFPHGAARALASRRFNTLGAIVPTVDNAIFARSIKGLQDHLFEAGFTLLLASSDYSEQRELREVHALLAHGIDGLVLVGRDHHPSVLARLAQTHVPYVFIWSSDTRDGHPGIGFDNEAAAVDITRHLLGLGHRRIALIAGITGGNDRARARAAGVARALAECHLTLDPQWRIEAPYTIAAGRSAANALLRLHPRPTALVCGNDVLAMGALFEAQAMGLRVPHDVSITGFDNIELVQHLAPSLTTIDIPATQMGRSAAQYLMATLAGEEITVETELPTRLIIRETTAHPPAI